jgi:hypothetical protein
VLWNSAASSINRSIPHSHSIINSNFILFFSFSFSFFAVSLLQLVLYVCFRQLQHGASEVMTSREEQVLTARDPAVEDENEWEEFSLTDVKVLVPGKSRYANLLTAAPDNPVRVIGCLDEVEEEQARLGMYVRNSPSWWSNGVVVVWSAELSMLHCFIQFSCRGPWLMTHPATVLDDDYLSKRIVIENVTHYAYGQHADGEIGIWVAGQAGWYSIVPAKGYRPMYNDMVEAIDLLYFLVDRHQRQKRKRRNGDPSFEYLCDEVGGSVFCL